MKRKVLWTCLFLIGMLSSMNAQRYMENLNRGTVAVRTSTSEVLVSWRILGQEYTSNATYNLYRGSSLIASDLSVSNYVDNVASDESYSVAAVIDGIEQAKSAGVTPWSEFYKLVPTSRPSGGTTPDDVSYTYTANDCSVGDLDGDGDYEIVIKWQPSNAKDNAQGGYTGNTILEGIEMDGTSLWKIDLGRNIRSGAHYTQFMVYDLDSDGDAEVVCKTADATVDGQGNVIGDANADYRNSSGWILDGPEFLTVFSGVNGQALKTTNYIPARGNVCDWGDCYGNRVDRFLACVAYLDGEQPSVVMCRGYYTRIVAAAWDYRNGNLTNRWTFDTDNGYSSYAGQGNHNLAVGDVDGDGKDEIMYGSCAIDDDGTGLYNTGDGHGDAGHLADVNPNTPGLEFFMCHEGANGSTVPGISLRNAATGSYNFTQSASGDIGRCLTADIDPNHLGYEMWGSLGGGIRTCTGSVITTTQPTTAGGGWTYSFGVWWDGDLLRELLDRTVLTKWNAENDWTDRVSTLYNYGAADNNYTKYNPCLSADIMGDWREEIIYRHYENENLMIFSTPHYTDQRMYTLMHDPIYRLSIAWQNVGYNMPPNVGFYFGTGMSTPPNPNIKLVGGSEVNSELWLEAECGTVGSLWETTTDANASNEEYVTIQTGNNSTGSAPTNSEGQITYDFSVSAGGSYNLWARVITPVDTDDSFWIKMDDGAWLLWNNLGNNTSWTWLNCDNYSLSSGNHTLTIAYREDGALLDKLYIGTSTPSGIGSSAENCSVNSVTYYRLQNRGSGLYLDGMGRTGNGEACGQYANTTHINAQWIFESVDGYYKIKNRGTGMYLDGMGRTTNSDACGQNASSSSYNQQWEQVSYDGYYQFRNRGTGMHLDGYGRTEDGSDVAQYDNTTHVNAQWSLTTIKNGKTISTTVDNDLSIYPNPTSDGKFVIDLSNSSFKDDIEVSICSSNGQIIFSKNYVAQEFIALDLTLEQGIYFVTVSNGDQIINEKLIVK